jgi:hypothetical protein
VPLIGAGNSGSKVDEDIVDEKKDVAADENKFELK